MTVRPQITELKFDDDVLATLELPGGSLRVTRGVGSGLCADAAGRLWAVGDRGPNLKVPLALERYGLVELGGHRELDGAKVMPFPEIGPAITELTVDGGQVSPALTIPLTDSQGRSLSGLPTPGGEHSVAEPAIGLDGASIPPDPSGADTEGIASDGNGGFWVGDEYGPSLLRVGANGQVAERWVPAGCDAMFAGSRVPVRPVLPAIAARRRLNRGFEALATSPNGPHLYLMFQSPLAHPDEAAHRRGRHVRLWLLDLECEAVTGEWLYPLDAPETFQRDRRAGPVVWEDLKVSELLWAGEGRLVVLERGSATTKLYLVAPDRAQPLDPAFRDPATRPTLEELSAAGAPGLPVLTKQLLLSSDEHPTLGPDLEGMALLPDGSLLLVNDNDFGIEGVKTRFWRVTGLDLSAQRGIGGA